MQKIMILMPFDIFPPFHGTSTSSYDFVKYLSKEYSIYLFLTRIHSRYGEVSLDIKVSYLPTSILDRCRMPSLFFNPIYFNLASRIMKEFEPDIIHCEVLYTALAGVFLKKRFKKPLVFVNHNCEYLKFRDIGKPWYITYPIKQIERCVCKNADKIIALSEVDKNQLVSQYKINNEKVEIISSNLDLNLYKFTIDGREKVRKEYGVGENDIIFSFSATFETIPNIEAVKNIAEIIYPAIISKYPNSKFLMIGRNEDKVLRYKKENIIFTGYLDTQSYLEHLSASDIVLVPLDSGSGIRMKILDASACSRAIVSTDKGAEGLNFIHQKEILIAPKVDDEFIRNIITLIDNRKLRETIGENARKKMVKEYSIERKIERFKEVYDNVLNNKI